MLAVHAIRAVELMRMPSRSKRTAQAGDGSKRAGITGHEITPEDFLTIAAEKRHAVFFILPENRLIQRSGMLYLCVRCCLAVHLLQRAV